MSLPERCSISPSEARAALPHKKEAEELSSDRPGSRSGENIVEGVFESMPSRPLLPLSFKHWLLGTRDSINIGLEMS